MSEPNTNCDNCGGSGFIVLGLYDGPDEVFCPCTRGTCDCPPCCRDRHAAEIRQRADEIAERYVYRRVIKAKFPS